MKKIVLFLMVLVGGLLISAAIETKTETSLGVIKTPPYSADDGVPCKKVKIHLENGDVTEQCVLPENTEFDDAVYPLTIELDKNSIIFFGDYSLDRYSMRSKS